MGAMRTKINSLSLNGTYWNSLENATRSRRKNVRLQDIDVEVNRSRSRIIDRDRDRDGDRDRDRGRDRDRKIKGRKAEEEERQIQEVKRKTNHRKDAKENGNKQRVAREDPNPTNLKGYRRKRNHSRTGSNYDGSSENQDSRINNSHGDSTCQYTNIVQKCKPIQLISSICGQSLRRTLRKKERVNYNEDYCPIDYIHNDRDSMIDNDDEDHSINRAKGRNGRTDKMRDGKDRRRENQEEYRKRKKQQEEEEKRIQQEEENAYQYEISTLYTHQQVLELEALAAEEAFRKKMDRLRSYRATLKLGTHGIGKNELAQQGNASLCQNKLKSEVDTDTDIHTDNKKQQEQSLLSHFSPTFSSSATVFPLTTSTTHTTSTPTTIASSLQNVNGSKGKGKRQKISHRRKRQYKRQHELEKTPILTYSETMQLISEGKEKQNLFSYLTPTGSNSSGSGGSSNNGRQTKAEKEAAYLERKKRKILLSIRSSYGKGMRNRKQVNRNINDELDAASESDLDERDVLNHILFSNRWTKEGKLYGVRESLKRICAVGKTTAPELAL